MCHACTTPTLPTGTSLLAKPDHPPLPIFLGSHDQSVKVDTWTKAICCTCRKRPGCQHVRRWQRLSWVWLLRARSRPLGWSQQGLGSVRALPLELSLDPTPPRRKPTTSARDTSYLPWMKFALHPAPIPKTVTLIFSMAGGGLQVTCF